MPPRLLSIADLSHIRHVQPTAPVPSPSNSSATSTHFPSLRPHLQRSAGLTSWENWLEGAGNAAVGVQSEVGACAVRRGEQWATEGGTLTGRWCGPAMVATPLQLFSRRCHPVNETSHVRPRPAAMLHRLTNRHHDLCARLLLLRYDLSAMATSSSISILSCILFRALSADQSCHRFLEHCAVVAALSTRCSLSAQSGRGRSLWR